MNDIILVVLPDGSVHRATLIEPGLAAPVYLLGKKAGAKERKPRVKAKAPTLVVSRGPASAGLAPVAEPSQSSNAANNA